MIYARLRVLVLLVWWLASEIRGQRIDTPSAQTRVATLMEAKSDRNTAVTLPSVGIKEAQVSEVDRHALHFVAYEAC